MAKQTREQRYFIWKLRRGSGQLRPSYGSPIAYVGVMGTTLVRDVEVIADNLSITEANALVRLLNTNIREQS